MNTLEVVIKLVLGIVAVGGGFVVGYRLLFGSRLAATVSANEAIKLLERGKPEEWNEFRVLNPGWIPVLSSIDLRDLDLAGINLSQAILRGVNLGGSNLEGSDLRDADLVQASLKGCNLRRVRLDRANLNDADLSDASFTGASLIGTTLPAMDKVKLTADEMQSTWKTGKPTPEMIQHIVDNPEMIYEINPTLFEELVGELLASNGYSVEMSSRVRDGGYDIIARAEDSLGVKRTFLVECKSYSKGRKVGIASARNLYGVKLQQGTNGAIMVTTSYFTSEAKKFAARYPDLQLVEYDELVRWLETHKSQ